MGNAEMLIKSKEYLKVKKTPCIKVPPLAGGLRGAKKIANY